MNMENMATGISNQAGTFRIRPIRLSDSAQIRDIILETLIEHGATGGGFASSDWDTQNMFEAFQREGRKYFIIEREGAEREGAEALPYRGPLVLGGAGIASLPGEPGTCELVKMYFRPEIRGLGLGKQLLLRCLEEAKKMGYTQIYLETIEQMKAARGLYEHLGFERIPNQMGNTGHFSCDLFYLRSLEDRY
jgi:putative acetyltransferase